MNRIEYDWEVVTPDPNNPHNYMLDTSAINEIAENIDNLNELIKSKEYGYKYYKTSTQIRELNGAGAKTYDKNGISSSWSNPPKWLQAKLPLFEKVLDKLSVQRVSSVGLLMNDHFLLDGNYRIMPDVGINAELIDNISQLIEKHPKWKTEKPFAYHYDVVIAEAAVDNNCILVAIDQELLDEVNKLFPGRAIKYIDLMNGLRALF